MPVTKRFVSVALTPMSRIYLRASMRSKLYDFILCIAVSPSQSIAWHMAGTPCVFEWVAKLSSRGSELDKKYGVFNKASNIRKNIYVREGDKFCFECAEFGWVGDWISGVLCSSKCGNSAWGKSGMKTQVNIFTVEC